MDSRQVIKAQVYEGAGPLPAAIGSFLQRQWRGDFFLSESWFDLVARFSLPAGFRPRVYAATRAADGAVLCVLPMACENPGRRGGLRRLTSLTSFYTMRFAPVLLDDEGEGELALHAVADYIARERPSWDAVDLRCLIAESPATQALLRAFRHAGMVADLYFQFENWYHPTNGVSGEAYFKSRSSQLRNTVTRKARKAAKEHRIEIRICREAADLGGGMADYERVYARSWKTAERFPDFIPNLLLTAARSGMLRLGLLHVDGVAAAAQIWLVTPLRAIIYKLAYDEAYAALSVGSILTKHMFDHVLDVDKASEIDYGVGSEPYKLDWMSEKRRVVGLLALNPRRPGGLLLILRRFGSKLLRRLSLAMKARAGTVAPAAKRNG